MASERLPRASLGIEVGRAHTTGVLLDRDGRILARAQVEHPPVVPRPGLLEQEPEVAWAACREVIARLKALVEVELVALGLAGEAGGVVFLDRAGRPLRRTILGGDRRAEAELREIHRRLAGAGLPEAGGWRPGACPAAAKILWLAANEPPTAQRVAKVLAPKDAVRLRLTGELATDASEASASGLLDVALRRWSGPLLEALAIAPDLLPEVFEGADVSGRVSVAGAAETGLPEGLPVVAGGSTLACGALAAGILGEGRGLAWLEPGAGILVEVAAPPGEPDEALEARCAATGGWHLLATLPLAASPLAWFARGLQPEWADAARAAGLEPEAALLGEAARAAPGAAGLLFLPALEDAAEGAGSGGAWLGLGPGHGRRELARSLLEGLGLALAERLARLRSRLHPRAPLRLLGRAAQDETWRALLAAQLGLPLSPLGGGLDAARGAAMLAGLGVGLWADAGEAVARAAAAAGPATEVDPQLQALYRAVEPARARAAAVLATLRG